MKKLTILSVVILTMIITTSCEKSNPVVINDSKKSQKSLTKLPMRKFKDFNEFYNEVEKTLGFCHIDLVSYEEKIGFNSFGKISEQKLYSIIEKDINLNKDQLLKVIRDNSDFLQINNIKGEEYLETKYF